MYSKGAGQNTEPTQRAISRFNLYVADMINWPTPSAAETALTQGQYYKRQNPQLLALMYFHCCLYSDTEYTPAQFTIRETRYVIDPSWYLTYAGSTLAQDITSAATHLAVHDVSAFTIGDRVMLGGAGQSQAELAIVLDKSAANGRGELSVDRGLLSQGGRFPAVDHSTGDFVRPVAHAFGSGKWMLLNPTSSGPRSSANPQLGEQTWNEFVAAFLVRKLDDPAFSNIDGYMLDNFVDSAKALVDEPARIDLHNVNAPSGLPDSVWSEAMLDLATRVRSSLPNDRLLVANDGGQRPASFGQYLNGGTIEGIDEEGAAAMHGGVDASLTFYTSWMRSARRPPVFLFNGSPHTASVSVGATQYRALRFLLALALTDDGYFVFDDFNVQDSHETLWWYDEYDNAGQQTGYLGQPLGAAFLLQPGVYRRDFERGISLANTTPTQRRVELGGVFRKIAGRQAPDVNDGRQVTSVQLPPRDGLILLRPTEVVVQ